MFSSVSSVVAGTGGHEENSTAFSVNEPADELAKSKSSLSIHLFRLMVVSLNVAAELHLIFDYILRRSIATSGEVRPYWLFLWA